MKGPAIAACVFCFFMAAAYSLKCVFYREPIYQEHFDENAGNARNCSSEFDVCLTIIYVLEQRSENRQNGFQCIRACGKSTECDLKESLTTPTYRVRFRTSCCTTDSCLPNLPVLPVKNDIKNGVLCPACYSNKENLCVPKRSMECTGDETHCIYYNETLLKAHNLHSYGCGSKNIFKDKGRIVDLFSVFSKITISEVTPIQGLKPGNFLWCHFCHEINSASCSKHRALCDPDEEVCVSERRRITDENTRRLTMQIRKQCGKYDDCQFNGIISNREKILTIKTSCCDTDLCITAEPLWSLKRSKDNGRTCPSCFPSNNTSCRPTDIIKCNGDQTHCIHYSSTMTKDGSVLLEEYNGCSSAGICEHATIKPFELPQHKITTEIICSGGIRIIHQLLSLVISKCAAWSLLKLS
ncbi:uncharacterized protein LOC130294610 [Hyla sarda]|uniref:uncharacterized protein LOC130294610 n=1 Tax=Hyla sarda TaxID=327740 RepID=UPI0024C2CEB3|nr:uncharacterized protein LOC130294610 [Hyla sarda]XP_056400719.1 uncharacterized protein LOC130294610 [Hyla sarda]